MIKNGNGAVGSFVCSVLVGVLVVTPALAGPGTYYGLVGAGLNVAPDYEGSDDYELQGLPVVALGWKSDPIVPKGGTGVQLGLHDIELGFPMGLEVGLAKLYRPEGVYKASAGLSYEFGRDEGDNDALRGLGDIDGHGVGQIGINFETEEPGWEYGLSYQRALSSEDYGATLEGQIGYAFGVSEGVKLTPSAQMVWADEDHMQSYFGVTQAQAANSAHGRFEAGSGIKSYAIGAELEWALTENWVMSGDVAIMRLAGDAADSPIVKNEGSTSQFSSVFSLLYMF